MGFSLGLAAYLALSPWLVGYANRKLAQRLKDGKENPDRIEERRGIARVDRPDGTLIWFHAASVGESLSLLDLIDRLMLARPDLKVLMTTGTRSSADLLEKRLPDGAIHQFAPIDVTPFVNAFLDHWKPDLAIWTESEFWPAMIARTHKRGIRLVLLNARMSTASYQKWRWLRLFIGSLLGRFSHILAQDDKTVGRLIRLGAKTRRTQATGSLKASTGALPHNEAERADLALQLQARPVWLAASTHPGEEEIVAKAHKVARRSAHRLLLIIAPRHPERGPDIATILRDQGHEVGVRSEGDDPTSDMDIYVADTLGEMGLWYRLSAVSFVGGSLVEIGGHNPYEPAALGSAILHGPHVSSAAEVYAQLNEVGGARLVPDVKELAHAVVDLQAPHKAAAMAHAAWEFSSSTAEATDTAEALLNDLLDDVETP